MMRILLLSLAVSGAFLLAVAGRTAFAQNIPNAAGAISDVGGELSIDGGMGGATGGDDIGSLVLFSMTSVRRLVNIVAILVIVITGFLLVTAQDEGQLAKARNTLIATVTAMVLINVAEPVYNALNRGFIGQGTGGIVGGDQGATVITAEVLGFINFIEVPLLVIAVLMIIISGIRAVLHFGNEQGLAEIKRTVISILAGIIIIGAKFALAAATAGQVGETDPASLDPSGIVETVVHAMTVIVSFMALAAVTVIVIAGIIMVFNKGDQETATKARGLILRVLIGLLVILISYGVVVVFTRIES